MDKINIIDITPPSPPALPSRCANCHKAAADTPIPLSKCGKCKVTEYCTRGCQLADWKSHKKNCGKPVSPTPTTPAGFPPGFEWFNHPFFESVPEIGGTNDLHPLTRYTVVYQVGTDAVTWLSSLSRSSVYSQLIDSYRVRAQEEHGVFPGVYPNRSYFPALDFHRFLLLAAGRDCLPVWWHDNHTVICKRYALREDGGACVLRPVTASELKDRYGENDANWRLVVTQLRRMAKQIYRCEAQRRKGWDSLEGLLYFRKNGRWGLIFDQNRGDGYREGL